MKMISISAEANQFVQWWDAHTCRKSKKFLKIPLEQRHYMILIRLEDVELVKHTGSVDLGEDEYWDLEDRIPPALRGEPFRMRRVMPFPAGDEDDQLSSFDKTLRRELDRNKNRRDCRDLIYVIMFSVADGELKLLDWDEHGCMRFLDTRRGARKIVSVRRAPLSLIASLRIICWRLLNRQRNP
jgi:hypothetical protein